MNEAKKNTNPTLSSFPELTIKTTENQHFEIPVEGSLGLLALGDIGLIAWRQKKLQLFQEQEKAKHPEITG